MPAQSGEHVECPATGRASNSIAPGPNSEPRSGPRELGGLNKRPETGCAKTKSDKKRWPVMRTQLCLGMADVVTIAPW